MYLSKRKHLSGPINEYLQTKEIKVSAEDASVAVELVKTLYAEGLDKFVGPPWVSGRHPLSANSATRCLLQNWFKHNQFPGEPLHSRVIATFRMGNIVELELYLMALLAGEEISDYQHQAHIDRAGWTTNNYLDFIHRSKVDEKRRVVDAKSMGSFGYQKLFDWNKPMDDLFGYLGQMSTYVDYALEAGLVDSDEGLFLCYSKDKGYVDEYIVPLDKALVAQAHASAKVIQDHTEYMDCPDCNGTGQCEVSSNPTTLERCGRCTGVPLVSVGAADARRPPRPPRRT